MKTNQKENKADIRKAKREMKRERLSRCRGKRRKIWRARGKEMRGKLGGNERWRGNFRGELGKVGIRRKNK